MLKSLHRSGGIYTASKTIHAPKWIRWRDELGAPICSTWIDEAGAGQTLDFNSLWNRCLTESANCDVLVIYCELGEMLKGAWIELGAALTGRTERIHAVGIQDFTIAKYGKITHYDSIEEAMCDACAFCGVEVVR